MHSKLQNPFLGLDLKITLNFQHPTPINNAFFSSADLNFLCMQFQKK